MMNEKQAKMLAITAALLAMAGFGALVYFAEWLAALLAFALLVCLSIHVGRTQGSKKGITVFVKEFFTGW
jgi:hypothetical protein